MFKSLQALNRFNIQLDKVYVIYWEPPETYITEAHPLLLEVFKGFKDKWTIIVDNQEKEIHAIVLFYGLPITKTPKNELDPNLEHLEKATSKHAYYIGAMIWVLKYLENLEYGQFRLLLDLMTRKMGTPVKVKELEGKNISLHTGVFKGKLHEIYLLIQEGKNIDITMPGGVRWFSIFGFKHLFGILGEAIKRDPRLLFFIMAGVFIIILSILGIIFTFNAFSILNKGPSGQGPFSIIEINGTECIAKDGTCIYYINPAVP